MPRQQDEARRGRLGVTKVSAGGPRGHAPALCESEFGCCVGVRHPCPPLDMRTLHQLWSRLPRRLFLQRGVWLASACVCPRSPRDRSSGGRGDGADSPAHGRALCLPELHVGPRRATTGRYDGGPVLAKPVPQDFRNRSATALPGDVYAARLHACQSATSPWDGQSSYDGAFLLTRAAITSHMNWMLVTR